MNLGPMLSKTPHNTPKYLQNKNCFWPIIMKIIGLCPNQSSTLKILNNYRTDNYLEFSHLTFCEIPRVKINNTNIVYKITL